MNRSALLNHRVLTPTSSFILLVLFIISNIANAQNDRLDEAGFYAFYTCYGQRDDITGPYADIAIKIGTIGEVVFNRESSYLPFFQTKGKRYYFDEIIKRIGDGTDIRPDADNKYSYVRIIKNSPEEILIHWRYMPDIHNVEFGGVVHEYFYFYPDGSVKREIKEGKDNLVDFSDPRNKTIQELQLIPSGIKEITLKKASLSRPDVPSGKANIIKQNSAFKPAFWLKFDEGVKSRKYNEKDLTYDAVSGNPSIVKGNITLYKSGISGTALAFDGYDSKVVIPYDQLPYMANGFTIDAWVAIGAYPWNWAPIIDLISDDKLYFGINDIGQLGFTYSRRRDTLKIVSDEEIPINKWTHVAVTVNPSINKVAIFINGKEVKEKQVEFKRMSITDRDAFVGLNRIPMRTTYHVSRDYPPYIRTPEGNQPGLFGLEGLIDELKIFSSPLTTDEVYNVYNSEKPTDEIINNPDLEKRILPGEVDGKNAEKFGAYYTKLKYHDLWDNLWRTSDYPDIVVRFDNLPASVVYWRGTNYGPGWVTENNRWMSDQSCESSDYYGCAEHMADKQNRYSHVRIIENNPARVVIHWRYATTDITYSIINRKSWADEYHYIYPDGTAIRHVTFHEENPGWQDVQFLTPAGESPEDQINLQALTVANLKGEIEKMDWTNGIPKNNIKNAVISVLNFKSDYKVIVIYPENQIKEIEPWGDIERFDKSKNHFAGPWNHWPVSQMPNDGRYAPKQDRVTSSALGGADPRDFALYGFTDKDIKDLIPLGRFFNRSPAIEIIKGASEAKFVQSEKAYYVDFTGPVLSFKINASEESPMVNPAFVIKNWKNHHVKLTIDGKSINHGKDFRYGVEYDVEGKPQLIVWIKYRSEKKTEFVFSPFDE
jgi:hypothetical protein